MYPMDQDTLFTAAETQHEYLCANACMHICMQISAGKPIAVCTNLYLMTLAAGPACNLSPDLPHDNNNFP